MSKNHNIKIDDFLEEQLTDPEFAAEYIKVALEEDDPQYFLQVLQRVVKANGVQKTAELTQLSRQGLHKMFSTKGNPSFANVYAILKAMKLSLQVVPQA